MKKIYLSMFILCLSLLCGGLCCLFSFGIFNSPVKNSDSPAQAANSMGAVAVTFNSSFPNGSVGNSTGGTVKAEALVIDNDLKVYASSPAAGANSYPDFDESIVPVAGSQMKIYAYPAPGYNFLGWFSNRGCTSKVSSETMYNYYFDTTYNGIFYAKFAKSEASDSGIIGAVAVTFNASYPKGKTDISAGGTVSAEVQVMGDRMNIIYPTASGTSAFPDFDDTEYHYIVNLSVSATAASGYTFKGWYDTPACNGTVYSTAFDYIFDAGMELIDLPGGNLVLYAKFERNKSTVNVYKGGTGIASVYPSTTTVYIGETVTILANTGTGYIFTKWTSSNSSSASAISTRPVYNFTANSSSYTFYAWATPIKYSVRFNSNNGKNEIASQTDFTYNVYKPLRVNTFTWTGYKFLGWAESATATTAKYTDGASVRNLTSSNNKIVDLYAVWKPSTWSIRYNSNDGTNRSYTQSGFVYGVEKAMTLNNFTRQGYTFEGWSNTPEKQTSHYVDGCILSSWPASYPEGYYLENGVIDLYALWDPIIYTITFHSNDGTGRSYSQTGFVYDEAKALTLNTFRQEGYKFLGWAESPTATAAQYTDCESVFVKNMAIAETTVNLYAVWKPSTWSIRYNSNDGTNRSFIQSGFVYGVEKAMTLQEFTREGYTFDAWAFFPGGGVISYLPGCIMSQWPVEVNMIEGYYPEGGYTENYVFDMYALWDPISYTITFHSNDGTERSYSQTDFIYDEAQALTLNTFERTGYRFLGWAQTSTATTAQYTDGESVIVKNFTIEETTVNLYAVWEAVVYTVKLYLVDLSSSYRTVNVTYGQVLPTITPPTRGPQWLFKGYTSSVGGGGRTYYYCDGEGIAYNHDYSISLYGNWAERWYSATKPAGNGTESSPYLIASEENLAYLSTLTDSTSHFKQTANIDLAGKLWSGINNFKGVYDGQGYMINNLITPNFVNKSGRYVYSNVGLFKSTTNATIKNILLNSTVYGVNNVGGLVGQANYGTISNCKVQAEARGENQVGILVGKSQNATISSCIVKGEVSLERYNNQIAFAGGLIGDASGTNNINNCLSKCTVKAYHQNGNVTIIGGGLVGCGNANLTACGFEGNAAYNMGNFSGTITNCVALPGCNSSTFSRSASVVSSLNKTTWIGGTGDSSSWKSVDGQLLPIGLIY